MKKFFFKIKMFNYKKILSTFMTFRFWLALSIGLFVGGLIGYMLFPTHWAVQISSIGIIIAPVVAFIYIFKNNMKDLKIITLLTLLVILISAMVAYSSSAMAKFGKFNIQTDTWVNFYGTIIGSAIGVLGAVALTQTQIKANKQLQDENLIQEQKNTLILLNLLVKEEISRNYVSGKSYVLA